MSLASRSWTLCPGETTNTPPALFPAGELDKILRLSPWRTWAAEKSFIEGLEGGEHTPTTAHLLEDVDLVDESLYLGPAQGRIGYGEPSLLRANGSDCRRIADGVLLTGWAGSRHFGQRLLDDFPRALLAEDGLERIDMVTHSYPHEPEYRQLTGLPSAQTIRRARIDRLVLFTDYGQNSLKEKRYRQLRAAIRQHMKADAGRPPAGAYIRRGPGGEARILENEPEVEAVFREHGFNIIDCGSASAREITLASLDAPVFAGVEGSHVSHGMFSTADQGTFLVLQPPERFAMTHKEFTDRMDMRFAFVVGTPSPLGFVIDTGALADMLERIARTNAVRAA